MKMKLKDLIASAEVFKVNGVLATYDANESQLGTSPPHHGAFILSTQMLGERRVFVDIQQEVVVTGDSYCVFFGGVNASVAYELHAFKLTALNSSSDEREYDPMAPFEAREMGSDQRSYVKGPITGCDYDSGTLFPEMRLSSYKDAQAATKIANGAFKAGYEAHAYACRKLFGVKETWGR